MMLKTEDLRQPEVVIIDFGIAQHDADQKAILCGTPGYIPPETWETQKWFPKGDVFSMGVSMLQLVIDQVPENFEPPPPFPGAPAPPAQVLKPGIFTAATLQEGQRLTCTMPPPLERIPPHFGGMRSMIARCIDKYQSNRASAKHALADPWFTGGDLSRTSPPRAFAISAPVRQTSIPKLALGSKTRSVSPSRRLLPMSARARVTPATTSLRAVAAPAPLSARAPANASLRAFSPPPRVMPAASQRSVPSLPLVGSISLAPTTLPASGPIVITSSIAAPPPRIAANGSIVLSSSSLTPRPVSPLKSRITSLR